MYFLYLEILFSGGFISPFEKDVALYFNTSVTSGYFVPSWLVQQWFKHDIQWLLISNGIWSTLTVSALSYFQLTQVLPTIYTPRPSASGLGLVVHFLLSITIFSHLKKNFHIFKNALASNTFKNPLNINDKLAYTVSISFSHLSFGPVR